MLEIVNFIINGIALFMIMLLFMVFINKKRLKQFEDELFKKFLIINILMTISGLILGISVSSFVLYNKYTILVLNKIYLIFLFMWILTLTWYYLHNYLSLNNKTINNKSLLFFIIISITIITLLPLKTEVLEGKSIASGPAIIFTYVIFSILFLIQVITMLLSWEKSEKKKYIPLLIFIFLGVIALICIIISPDLNFIINPILTLIPFVMFNTIENPDVKLIEYERKEIDKIRQATESKSEFLSSTSHELRTPLNAIIGLSEDIETYKEINPEIIDDVKDLINASNILLDIISNILDSSKIESGKLDIIECDYDAKEEFESIGNIYKIKALKKGLYLNIDIDDNIPEVIYGDRQRIRQVISNLLDNAVKFTNVGKINYVIKWDKNKKGFIIVISDSGDGLRKEEYDTFLNANKDLRIEKVYSVQGTGLGLTITRNLIKLLNGYVTVDTKSFAGTKFTIYIPQKIGNIDEFKSMSENNEIDYSSLNYSGKRLLVVDDNPINIKVLQKAIKIYNFDIEECHNGQEAINMIEINNNYDLVFMDIMMPIMSGEEAIIKLNEMSNFATPVIALTADADIGATQKYKKMGFYDYMSKPFSREMIAKKLYDVFAKKDNDIGNEEHNNILETARLSSGASFEIENVEDKNNNVEVSGGDKNE